MHCLQSHHTLNKQTVLFMLILFQISKTAGAYILTKGRYLTSEQRLTIDTTRDKPLFLYIQAETEANVQSKLLN